MKIWFYQGLVGVLLVIIWYLWQKQQARQDGYNKKFFELFEKTKEAITRLNTLLDGKNQLCDFKHQTIEHRLDKLEEKK